MVFPDIVWDLHAHSGMMILRPGHPYSPIDTVSTLGIGERIDTVPSGTGWTLCQRWTGLTDGRVTSKSRGHIFFVAGYDWASNRMLTVEANQIRGLIGVGHRGFGPIGTDVLGWKESESAPQWDFTGVQMARIL